MPALVAAAVAAVVTLVVEYLAKPTLEARKERILERHRAHRDLRVAWNRLNWHVGRVLAYAGDEVPPVEGRVDALGADVEAAVADVCEALRRIDAPEGDLADELILSATSAAEALHLMIRHGVDIEQVARFAEAEVDAALDRADDALNLKRWQRRKRARLRAAEPPPSG